MNKKLFKITNVTDLEGNVKDERIIGTVRTILNYDICEDGLEVGQNVLIGYEDEEKGFRRTTPSVRISEDDNTLIIYTRNTIYSFDKLSN